jgi:CRISPR-associated endonuclease/helicase Cas3
LIAWAVNKLLPRRLIYVVDRRTVVDQATDTASDLAFLLAPDNPDENEQVSKRNPKIVERKRQHAQPLYELRQNLGFGDGRLAVSTLRGQLADNREWSRDLSRPAIIIGTVDLIGSALLFSGYRAGFKTRPLHAGLLGQDSLLVLDEAHLSKPFEKLVTSISKFQQGQGTPMKVIRMSATSGNPVDDDSPFTLMPSDLDDATIKERFEAPKRLTVESAVEKAQLNAKLANAAIRLATDVANIGKRIVVFVRSPDDAKTIAGLIRDHEIKCEDNSGKKPKTVKTTPFGHLVEILTGTMRGLERDELIETPILKRFLDGDICPSDEANQHCVFLISTSAGEVGFDLNADHMVCDTAPFDSMIQRLGRVNRRGKGDAAIVLIPEAIKTTDKAGKPRKPSELEQAIMNTVALLKHQTNVSPRAIAELKSRQTPAVLSAACTPEPTMVEVTDILLDAWSMTSITERMPGRPEVAPWLRGIDVDLPQTTIAWRAELDLFKDEPNPRKLLKAIFAKHRIRAHESLTTNSYRVVQFFKEITKKRPELLDTRVVVKFSRDLIVRTIGKLIDDDGILNADPTLILPATFGGLDKGMLSHEAIPPAPNSDDPPPKSLDVADEPGYEPRQDACARLRILIERTDDGWKAVPLPGGAVIPIDLNLEPSYATSKSLIRAMESTDLRVRLVQPVAFDDEDVSVKSLVILSPIADKTKQENQPLAAHVGAVQTEAQRIADEFGLKDPIRAALLFAAKWHDEGKKAAIWQNYVYGTDPDTPKGKSASTRDPKSLRGYRHEFGSLLRLHHPEEHATDCTLPTDYKTRELALHLIATHHGFARPHFDNPVDRDFKTTQCETIHTESIRRFARLQRKYGWWQLAWLENLLRCADALASADQDAEANEADNAAGDEQ